MPTLDENISRLADYLDSCKRPKKILIVDDSGVDTAIFRQAIIAVDCDAQIDEAVDGNDAIGMIFAKDYDLVLLDLRMPSPDGLEVIRQVKAREELPNIVTVSGDENGPLVSEAMKMGVVMHMPKEATVDATVGSLRKIFRHV